MKKAAETMLNEEFNEMIKGFKNVKVDENTTLPNYFVNENGEFIRFIRNDITNTYFNRISANTSKSKSDGYYVISLDVTRTVHRVLAYTFIKNDDPINKKDIDHIDGNHFNNNLNNLRWCTHKDNMNAWYKSGRAPKNHNNYGKYRIETRKLHKNDGTIVNMEPLEYITYRKNHGLDTSKIYNKFSKLGLI